MGIVEMHYGKQSQTHSRSYTKITQHVKRILVFVRRKKEETSAVMESGSRNFFLFGSSEFRVYLVGNYIDVMHAEVGQFIRNVAT